MDFVIVIPTFNRVKECFNKTLTFLKNNKIQSNLIKLIVHNEEQKKLYEELPNDSYGEIIVTNLNEGLVGQRNFIVDYFSEDTKIISLDDDVSDIYEVKDNKLIVCYNLLDIIKEGFELCEKNNYTLWGLYPTTNAFYVVKQKHYYTTDLRFIVGAFMAFVNKKRKADDKLKIRQDYDLSIQAYLNDGGLIRFNRISVKYGIYNKNGGVGQSKNDRKEQLIYEADLLINKYNGLVRYNMQREGEILLNKSYKKKV